MADVTVVGIDEWIAALRNANPALRRVITGKALRVMAVETQTFAKTEAIIRGGSAPPVLRKLTSRTGRGRSSIRTDFSKLPRAAEVGSTLKYMALHETGGTVNRPATTVQQHMRNVLFGQRVKPFSVGPYTRRGGRAKYPARPWLAPSVARTVQRGPRIVELVWLESIQRSGVGAGAGVGPE